MKINIQDYQYQLSDVADRFRDIRFTGQVVFIGIVLLISWSGIKTIQSNYQLQKEISALRQENSVHLLENSNLQLQNEYYKTDQYLELSARRNFGLGKPGETELLVSQAVAYKYAPDIKTQLTEQAKDEAAGHSSNFQAWVNFFLNRPSH